ncbi:MAG TPA: ComEA family DNA-binding protein [Candidatus Limnocylindrales bacterium]|nr:ComEA family DNA-binding protein [Candidatus Limnocylindrales bacterium]
MEPSATPPWRVLETPPPDKPARPATVAAAPPPIPVALKVVAGIVAAVACVGLAVAVAVGGGGDVRVEGAPSFAAADPSTDPDGSGGAAGGELVVEIVGAVQAPGVYRLAPGSRVADLVERAGGYGPRVDTGRAEQELNLAAPVKDGEHIRVPSRDDASPTRPGEAGSPGASSGGSPVDINSATQAQLEELPGIGPATAQKIIAAREEAPFGTVDDLRSRGVLGEKTFEKLRPLVTVG